MLSSYDLKSVTFQGPVEEILKKKYPLVDAIRFYNKELLPLVKGTKKDRLAKKKKPVKDDYIREIIALLKDPKVGKEWGKGLDKVMLGLYQNVCWMRLASARVLSQQLKIKLFNKGKYRYDVEMAKDYQSLFLFYEHGFSSYGASATEGLYLFLPPSLMDLIKPLVPTPLHEQMTPVKKPKADFCYNNMGQVLTQYQSLVHLREQKMFDWMASGYLKQGSLKKIEKTLKVRPFFENNPYKEMTAWQVQLWGGVLNLLDSSGRNIRNLNKGLKPVDRLKVYVELLEKGEMAVLHFITQHLRSKKKHQRRLSRAGFFEDLFPMFRALPLGEWVTLENLFNYCLIRDISLIPLDNLSSRDLYYTQEEDHGWGSYRQKKMIESENVVDTLVQPLLKGLCFFMSQLGLLEITYNLPSNKEVQFKDLDFLTPWDGLIAIKLTQLGSYCLGLTKAEDLPTELLADEEKGCVVELDEKYLILKYKGTDPLIKLVLSEVSNALSDGFYEVTFDSFLGDCRVGTDLLRKINNFKDVLSEDIPRNWQQFFDLLKQRTDPLEEEFDYVVYKLSNDPDLIRRLVNDPWVKKNALKVEGGRFAVLRKDRCALIRKMKTWGYLKS